MTIIENIQKCENCGKWTDTSNYFCQHCGKLLNEKRLEQEKQRHEQTKLDLILIKIKPTDSLPVVFVKRLAQGIQIIYMAILSFILWLITTVVL